MWQSSDTTIYTINGRNPVRYIPSLMFIDRECEKYIFSPNEKDRKNLEPIIDSLEITDMTPVVLMIYRHPDFQALIPSIDLAKQTRLAAKMQK